MGLKADEKLKCQYFRATAWVASSDGAVTLPTSNIKLPITITNFNWNVNEELMLGGNVNENEMELPDDLSNGPGNEY